MRRILSSWRDWSVGVKVALMALGLQVVAFGGFTLALSHSSTQALERQTIAGMRAENAAVADMVRMYDGALRSQVSRALDMFANAVPRPFSLDGGQTIDVDGRQVPVLIGDGQILSLDFELVDQFAERSGATATVFGLMGDEFVRVTTSVTNEQGQRAVGTRLDRNHAGYARLLSGEPYLGMATLFGKPFITKYEPIRNDAGDVVGALYVGVDISDDMEMLARRIKDKRLGESGYFFVADTRPGTDMGRLLVHRARQGQVAQDLDIPELMAEGEGVIHDLDPDTGRPRTMAYLVYPDWNWLIGGAIDTAEIGAEVAAMRDRFLIGGAALLAAMAVVLFLGVRRLVQRPLEQVAGLAQRLATGDLTGRLQRRGDDEVGRLVAAVNGIGEGFAAIVGKVRGASSSIAASSEQIAQGNADLSSRTAVQASNLEETAASMEELTAAVRQNAEHAQAARELAAGASASAASSGEAVQRAVGSMADIQDTARKIADITGIIDGIAFQTNILALNAAVEAARAGDHGRGFAVVASEVRALAQRSATAAKEISELIQRSVHEVGQGTERVRAAGSAMDEIVAQVDRMSQVIGEIANASAEQSNGIEQVNRAVGQMDDVTQQNAALVEEAAAAADSLRDQASALAAMVGVFKIDAGPDRADASAPAGARESRGEPRAGRPPVALEAG